MTTEPSDWMVSPTIRNSELSSPPTLDEQIDVFSSQVLGWQLNIAKDVIKRIPDSGFAALSIILSYFETIGKSKEGVSKEDRRSGHFFKCGFRDLLADEHPGQETEDMMTEFYDKVRCGLYHAGMTKNFVFLTGETMTTISYDPHSKTLTLNPRLLILKMIDHFKSYITMLKDPSNITERANFGDYFA